MKKWLPGAVPEKTLKTDRKLMQEGDALRGEKNVFALYLLQFKRLAGRNFDGKRSSQNHHKSTKIDHFGIIGLDFRDCGAVKKICEKIMSFRSAKSRLTI